MSIIKSTSYHIHIEINGFEALNTFLSKKEYSKYIIIIKYLLFNIIIFLH